MKWPTLVSFVAFFAIAITQVHSEKARYDFYRVYKVSVRNEVHLSVMQQIYDYPDGYKFFDSQPAIIGRDTQLIVPPHKFGEWSELIERYDLKVKLVNKNLQESIDKEEARFKRRKSLDWNDFWTLDEIYSWMQGLVDSRPSDLSIFTIGKSYEGRDIKGLRINVGGGNKPQIFYEATIHGGEWLAATSVTYIINEFLTNGYQHLNDFDWFFLPVVNVDGFTYAWSHDRLWRKTRRPNRSLLCAGADPNRNSNVHWNISNVSTNPCAHNYPGDFAFSEPEVKQLAEFVMNMEDLQLYFSFHTFGQFFMIPNGFTFERIEDYDLHHEIGQIATEAIFERTGGVYELGPVTQFFGLVSGGSFDWVYENARPLLTYCFELRPTWNESVYIDDFYLISSSALILPSAQDSFAATTTVVNEVKARGLL